MVPFLPGAQVRARNLQVESEEPPGGEQGNQAGFGAHCTYALSQSRLLFFLHVFAYLNSGIYNFQQAKAEQEEEFISNTLLKKIQALKKEKESLALNYEQEEECLTNDLSRKLNQV